MQPNVKRIISQLVNNLEIPRNGKSLDEDDSWYLTLSNGSYQNTEIRISNHKTDINTWAFRQYRGQSPSTRISIVFRDNNYAGNALLHEPIKKQISVTEYVYDLTDGSTLSDKEIAMLTKAIRAAASGSFVDPLGMATESDVVGKYVAQNTTTTNNGDTVPSTKWNHGMDYSIEESKTNKNMKKNAIKLNENTLRQIVAKSVKKILKEGEFNKTKTQELAEALGEKIDDITHLVQLDFHNSLLSDYGKGSDEYIKGMKIRSKMIELANDLKSELWPYFQHYDSHYEQIGY